MTLSLVSLATRLVCFSRSLFFSPYNSNGMVGKTRELMELIGRKLKQASLLWLEGFGEPVAFTESSLSASLQVKKALD
uniref:Protein EI24 homolog n=1 Tax=Rhizophora mucronata TaxID=61149 RepID=A0A2P2LHG7_RHIMU